MADNVIEVLLDEKRNFPPPKEFNKSANDKSAGIFTSARKNPQAFWANAATEFHWFKPWKRSWNGKRRGPSGLSVARSMRHTIASIATSKR